MIWQLLGGIEARNHALHDDSQYVVEVDFFDIKEKGRLYRDGRLVAEKSSPVSFDIGGATIKAAMALYGMKAAKLVSRGQRSRLLVPCLARRKIAGSLSGERIPRRACSWQVSHGLSLQQPW